MGNQQVLYQFYFLAFCAMIIFACQSCSAPDDEEYAPYLLPQAVHSQGVLESDSFPTGSISFEPGIDYIGSETFILYRVARCEIHLFAEKEGETGYKKIYWVQYEGYLPPALLPTPLRIIGKSPTYYYADDPHKTEIGGKQFYTSNSYHNIAKSDENLSSENGPKDSDFAHVTRLLYKNGISINGEFLGVRMVYLDPTSKKELMIIYYEKMDGDEINYDKLSVVGEESSLWAEVSSDLRKRARQGISITFDEGE